MWRPSLNFITLHYAWVIFAGILGLVIIYPFGNLDAVDAYFFGASASTESGLNTVDVKLLKTYQQLVIYFIPIITNLGFVNIIVVVVRLHWLKKSLGRSEQHLEAIPYSDSAKKPQVDSDRPVGPSSPNTSDDKANVTAGDLDTTSYQPVQEQPYTQISGAANLEAEDADSAKPALHLTFAEDTHLGPRRDFKRFVQEPFSDTPGMSGMRSRDPRLTESNHPVEDTTIFDTEGKDSKGEITHGRQESASRTSYALENAVSNTFVLGRVRSESFSRDRSRSRSKPRITRVSSSSQLPQLSKQISIGRNSNFGNLSTEDQAALNGLEYRSLKLLLKVIIIYFFGLHLFGAICLASWIHRADPKYRDYLASQGQDLTWWGFYSSQTMVNNLGFTLTPDSMISFRDAIFPMILMTFLAFAGNTFYPIFLRALLWVMHKATRKNSSTKEPLSFILAHPRRCYTLLFPSRPTWILFGILVFLNGVDVLLIIVLDLHNAEVASLPMSRRFWAALFQAASARHTGTATFNLANVNPAVQFSLLVMMYIAIYPIAISIRASNTYEERSLGLYEMEQNLDESKGRSYLMSHIRNQLSFDLWYIFLGVFCICVAEADKITDPKNPAFAVFPLFFEAVSAYGNVGLSLGSPDVLTSLCGKFTVFSKLVICALMIRGRHRGLPYALDHAVMLSDNPRVH